VPDDQNPGTNLDTDFYSSPAVQDLADCPPEGRWITCPNGVAPSPHLLSDLESSIFDTDMLTTAEDPIINGEMNPLIPSISAPPEIAYSNEFETITVQCAGSVIVNGRYKAVGKHNGAISYHKRIFIEGKWQVMCLFKCPIQDNRNRWYISKILKDSQPGTEFDIDYYSASVMEDAPNKPSHKGWVVAEKGLVPSPTLLYRSLSQETARLEDEKLSPTASTASMGHDGTSTLSSDEAFKPSKKLRVEGAHLPMINGIYNPAGMNDGVSLYQRHSFYKGEHCKITLFRCLVKGNKKYWYISLVTPNLAPGTIRDTDFYAAPANNMIIDSIPPEGGWITVGEGTGYAPTVKIQEDYPDNIGDENFEDNEERDKVNAEIAERSRKARMSTFTKVSLIRSSIKSTTTAKASGRTTRNKPQGKVNPLGFLVDEEAKVRLTQSGINAETINMPSVVTLNGQSYSTTHENKNG